MNKFYGYARVSTAKQGEGVPLQEQREAIARHAECHGFTMVGWFEEMETAAKRGRPIFNQMLKALRAGQADGVIIHKIDRSARNLKDWADLGELIDQGIDVRFANESLDLQSRGGRLSADIQAVVAADYIRNLREETRKGFYGRLKQGFYPLPAPVGYLDKGKAKPKELDPVKAPLLRQAFELYATGQYNLKSLLEELNKIGLRNRRGGKISMNGLSSLLNNPFYMGLIRLKRTGETFSGSHTPLVSKALFDGVQQVLRGKTNTRNQRHNLVFRRLLACQQCGRTLIGERQKGHVYYRCHLAHNPATCIREEVVAFKIRQQFQGLQFSEAEKAYFREQIKLLRENWTQERATQNKALELQLNQIQERLHRLTDAFLDGVIEPDLFQERKNALLVERKDLEAKMAAFAQNTQTIPDQVQEFLELAGSVYLSHQMGIPEEKRELVKITTSNWEVDGKNVEFRLSFPFCELADRFQNTNGDPQRDIPRTWDRLLRILADHFGKHPNWMEKLKLRMPSRYAAS